MASSNAPINSSLPACLPYACAPYHLRSLPPRLPTTCVPYLPACRTLALPTTCAPYLPSACGSLLRLPSAASYLPSACGSLLRLPWRRGYDRRPDLLFHSVRAGSNPADWPSSFPPHFCSYHTTRGKIIRRRKNYPAAA